MTEPATSTNLPDGAFTHAEEVASLARAIHEGDWTMVLEYRWERATRSEQEISIRRAEAVTAAHATGARTSEDFAAVISSIEWTVKSGSPGRLRAKADKVVQWYRLRQGGTLL